VGRLAAALDAHRREAPGAEAVAGDLAGELGEVLVDGVDAIVHAGATVSWLASYAALRGPNVHGTRKLLELAARAGIPFHFVSTISTAPATGDETTTLSFAEAAAGTPYGLSKWIAEDLARRAGAAVYRPAMIAPATDTGIGNRDDYLHRYMHGCLELGMYIDRDDARIDFTPVDHVAAAIAGLVRSSRRESTTHIVNLDRSPTFAGLGRSMVAAGAALRAVPYSEFRTALVSRRGSRLHALIAFFPETFVLGMGPWPCASSRTALAALGIEPPAIDDAYLARVLRAMSR
jgi:thioester reductase-like protein